MEVPMAMGRPKATLVLDSELREQLESLANSRSLPAGLVRRAKIILLSASRKTNREIAWQLETSKVTVGLWRRRFLAQGVSGLYEELRPGRPRPIGDERVAQLIRKTLKSKPKGATHWSSVSLPTRRKYRNRPCTASGRRLACRRIDKNISSFPTIHFL
jgi:putative transposase